jgi:CRP-like cAMP-binding protein
VDEGQPVALEQAELYRVLQPDRLERLRSVLFEKRFERGRVLFFEGEPAEYLWTIRRGRVRQYKSSADGRVTTLEILDPGQAFGAISALETAMYPVSAEGVTDGAAWCLPRTTFLRLLSELPELTAEVLRVVSGRLSAAQQRVLSLARDSASSRLAQALLRAARHGEAQVTRRELAESAATTVETAIRVMRSFERANLVEGRVGRILLRDEAAIRKIADDPHS